MCIDDMIRNNTGLIFKQLTRYKLLKDPEAESIGYEALYTAITTFDASKNIALSTYATVCIYNALGSYVRTLNKQRQLDVVSYNNTLNDDEDTEYLEIIASTTSVEEDVIKQETTMYVRRAYQEQYELLTNDRHKAILHEWYISDYKATTVDIANKVGVSQSYVSQVINNFKARLKKRLEEYLYG